MSFVSFVCVVCLFCVFCVSCVSIVSLWCLLRVYCVSANLSLTRVIPEVNMCTHMSHTALPRRRKFVSSKFS